MIGFDGHSSSFGNGSPRALSRGWSPSETAPLNRHECYPFTAWTMAKLSRKICLAAWISEWHWVASDIVPICVFDGESATRHHGKTGDKWIIADGSLTTIGLLGQDNVPISLAWNKNSRSHLTMLAVTVHILQWQCVLVEVRRKTNFRTVKTCRQQCVILQCVTWMTVSHRLHDSSLPVPMLFDCRNPLRFLSNRADRGNIRCAIRYPI